MTEPKEISEQLKQEYIIATKPQGDWRQFINLIIQRYEHATNSIYGYVVYDWLDEKGLMDYTSEELKQAVLKGKGNANAAKSYLMDILIANKKFTTEQLKGLLNA